MTPDEGNVLHGLLAADGAYDLLCRVLTDGVNTNPSALKLVFDLSVAIERFISVPAPVIPDATGDALERARAAGKYITVWPSQMSDCWFAIVENSDDDEPDIGPTPLTAITEAIRQAEDPS